MPIDIFIIILGYPYVGVGMGVGRSKIDKRWRVTIPVPARGDFKPGDEVVVEEVGGKIIISKAGEDALKLFREVKLYVKDEKLVVADAEKAKHEIGAVKE